MRRQYILGATTFMVIMLFVGIFTVKNYETTESEIQDALENANFTIYRIDLIKKEGYLVESQLGITNLNLTSLPSSMIEDLEMNYTLTRSGKTMFTGSVTNEVDFLENEETNITIQSPFTATSFSSEMLSLLVTNTSFSLDLNAQIYYRYFGLIRSIKFMNTVNFELSEDNLVNFHVLLIHPLQMDSNQTTTDYSIYNPFSVPMAVEGRIKVQMQEYHLLELNNLKLTLNPHSWNNVSSNTVFYDTLSVFIPKMVDNFADTMQLSLDVIVGLADHKFHLKTDFETVTGVDPPYELKLSSINELDLDLQKESFYVNSDFQMKYFIPFQLNVSKVDFTLGTKSGLFLSNSSWKPHTNYLSLEKDRTYRLENVAVNITQLNPLILLSILSDQLINVTSIEATIVYNNENIIIDLGTTTIDFSMLITLR